MPGRLHDFIKKHIVAEVPDEFEACLDCGAVRCSAERWDACPNRLARRDALRQASPQADSGSESERHTHPPR